MSRFPQENGPGGVLASQPRRAGASVSLREGSAEADSHASLMDPATKSLADALRITYRLVQAAMAILVLLYFLSGFQSVNESERAIRVSLGRAEPGELAPGFRYSWPSPLGDLVKVQIGDQPDAINDRFWPNMSKQDEDRLAKDGPAFLADGGSDSLDPDADGQLLTANGDIAHVRCSYSYRRVDAGANARNVDPDFERSIVRAAVRRGVIQAAASVTIDELMANRPDPTRRGGDLRSVETIATDIAQQSLNALKSGIEIKQLAFTQRIPPRRVWGTFNLVQSNQAKAGQEKEKARQMAFQTMTQAAGQAAPVVLEQIDRYERQLQSGDKVAAEQTLETINKIFLREPVEIDGKMLETPVSGEVSRILDEAREYRTAVSSRSKANMAVFDAKLQTYKTNPSVMLTGDWADAFKAFTTRKSVQTMLLPGSMDRLVLLLNRDPDISRVQEQERLDQLAKEADIARTRAREDARFKEKFDAGNRIQESR